MKFRTVRQVSWLAFVGAFGIAVYWTLVTPDYRAASKMHRNMMAMSTSAFQEAIIFTHLKYHVLTGGKGKAIDLIEVDNKGLDFNDYGFPVGIEHSEDSVNLEITASDCRQLWQTLLELMRPLIEPEENAVLTVVSTEGKCVFTSKRFIEQSIKYNPRTGRVSLVVAN